MTIKLTLMQVRDAAKAAALKGRLQAFREDNGGGCYYYLPENKSVCVVGAALPPGKERRKIRGGLNQETVINLFEEKLIESPDQEEICAFQQLHDKAGAMMSGGICHINKDEYKSFPFSCRDVLALCLFGE